MLRVLQVFILALALQSVWLASSLAGSPASMPTDDGGIITWIWDAFARGDLAIAVAGVILVLVRVVRGPQIQSRIPEKYLPWVSMGVATLAQISTALFAGAPWGKAVLIGVSTGLMASGLWSAGAKKLPKVGKANGAAPTAGILLLLLPLLVYSSGCGTTMQKLDLVNEETHQVMKQANPVLETIGTEEIAKCKKTDPQLAAKVPKDLPKQERLDKLGELCSGFKKTYTAQKAANLTASGIYMAAQGGAIANLLGKDGELSAALAIALAGLQSLKDILQSAGLFDLLKKAQ
uniref:Uncharacterized protein n=1 Tax=viral metagenome TaxID=1070528 RepID=A0A6H1Z8M9_9ZZZZ